MKLGVLTNVVGNMPLEDALKYFKSMGIQMVEIGCGGYPGKDHCDPEVLLHDEAKYQEFCDTIKKYDMEVSAFSCHGNPIHPNKELAAAYDKDMRNAVLMAEKYGLHQINCFSGCPGDCETSQYPNWVVCAWPDDFGKILEYQWKILVDYWKNFVAFAKEHGVNKIALEMHQGFCVYNTETLLKLREAVGPEIGANFDPSHLIWRAWIRLLLSASSAATQSSTYTQRIPVSISTTWQRTARSTRRAMQTKHTAPGSSAASATATICSIGRTSSALCALSAMTMPSALSTRIAS